MMKPRLSLVAAGLAIAVLLAGCHIFPDDFPVAVGNRTASTVTVFANGGAIGEVGSNQTATFSIDLSPIGKTAVDAIGNPISPAPIASATFTARDSATGVLSAGAATTLIHGVTAYVDVAPCLLLAGGSTGPICVSVANTSSGSSGSPTCSFSLSPSSQSFDSAGGTGTAAIQASSTSCSWTATSNDTWISITSAVSGTGNGTVVFQVQPNMTGLARTGTLTIAGQTFTVNQGAI
ncbi:MAG TPA: BACON domain-containing protein [Vicinamibacterales bacterium]